MPTYIIDFEGKEEYQDFLVTTIDPVGSTMITITIEESCEDEAVKLAIEHLDNVAKHPEYWRVASVDQDED